MSLVATLEALVEAGATPAMLLAVVRQHEATREAADAERRARDAKRQAKRRGLMPDNWSELRLAVFRRDDFTCTYCGESTEEPHCDHRTPLSRGGGNSLDNLTTACADCNTSKGARTVEEWRGGSS